MIAPHKSRIVLNNPSPLKIRLGNLVLGTTPSLLNCFLRFQRRCNLLIQTFPTMYDTTRFSEEISKEEQVNKNMESSGLDLMTSMRFGTLLRIQNSSSSNILSEFYI